MSTKKELIKIAQKQNIRFKKSWTKAKIQEAIEQNITNDSPMWIDCKYSGIKFDAIEWGVTERVEVHPTIAWWKQRANKENWYGKFFEAIEYGKENGFDSIEQFDEVFERCDRGLPFEKKSYNLELTSTGAKALCFRKPWVAKIKGLSEQYDYDRQFLQEDEIEGRAFRFNLSEDGVYQAKQYSSKGNEYFYFYQVKKGELSELSQEQVNEIFGDVEKIREKRKKEKEQVKLALDTAIHFVSPKYIGSGIIKYGKNYYKVLNTKEEDVDIDGIPTNNSDSSGYFSTDFHYYCREAKPHQVDVFNKAQEAEKEKKENQEKAKQILWEVYRSCDTNGEVLEPHGVQISISSKKLNYDSTCLYIDFEQNLVWSSKYNGRDGDLWDWNNSIDGRYIVRSQQLTGELREKLFPAIIIWSQQFPGAIQGLETFQDVIKI
jgi:hypothetical protein